MDNGTLFIDTFFKPALIVRYLPDILKGMAVTIEIAVLVVAAGISLGFALALIRSLRSRLVNALIVILPQAVRLTVPPLTNRTIAITKNTALGTVIGVPEILNQATTAESFSFNATPLMMGAIAYLVLFVPVVIAGRYIETRFAWRRA